MQLPSEHVYISRHQLPLLLPAVKKISARLAGANLGSAPHRFPLDRIDFQESARIYAGREYDKHFASQLQPLQNRLADLHLHGKLRLNLVHVTVLAFALRHNREAQAKGDPVVRELERLLENLRRRLKRATIRKFGDAFYAEFKQRWNRFVQWMNYYLLYDRKGHRRLTHHGSFRSFHKQQLDLVEAWLQSLIAERCERALPEDVLRALARRVKRRARQRRFGQVESDPGPTLRKMLCNKQKYENEVFAYIQRHVPLTLKFQHLDLSSRQSLLGERFRKSLTIVPDHQKAERDQQDHHERKSSTSNQSDPTLIRVPSSHPVATKLGLPEAAPRTTAPPQSAELHTAKKAELVDGVSKFFIRIDGQWRKTIAEQTIRQAPRFPAPKHTKVRLPFSLLVESAHAPEADPALSWSPFDISEQQLFWEVDWLLENLSRCVPFAEIPEIIRDGLAKANRKAVEQPKTPLR